VPCLAGFCALLMSLRQFLSMSLSSAVTRCQGVFSTIVSCFFFQCWESNSGPYTCQASTQPLSCIPSSCISSFSKGAVFPLVRTVFGNQVLSAQMFIALYFFCFGGAGDHTPVLMRARPTLYH
jgi:hypothetical protein